MKIKIPNTSPPIANTTLDKHTTRLVNSIHLTPWLILVTNEIHKIDKRGSIAHEASCP